MPRIHPVVLFFLVQLFFFSSVLAQSKLCLKNAKSPPSHAPTIKVNKNNWLAAELNAEILGILLREKLQYNVEFTEFNNKQQWESQVSGATDIVLETWPSGHLKNIQQYIETDKTVVHCGQLGVAGRIGWYMPSFMRDRGVLDSYTEFTKPAVTTLFNVNASKPTVGRMLSGPTTYTNYDEQLVKNLHLLLEVQHAATEGDLLAELDNSMVNGTALLFYFWTPHQVFKKYAGKLTRVSLPQSADGEPCQRDSIIQAGRVDCDYPADVLIKTSSMTLQRDYPDIYYVVQQFTLSNNDQIDMLADVEYSNLTPFEAACKWVTAHETRLNNWLPATKSLVPVIVPAVVVPSAVVLTVVVVMLIIIIVKVYDNALKKVKSVTFV